MTTLYIRHPARAEGEGALCRFAVVHDGGSIAQQGEGALDKLGDLVAASRRVVLLLAGADVSLVPVQAPPLAGARLRAALPALVEEHILGDPLDCVLVAGPALPDGRRPVAVVQRDWLEPIVRTLLGMGARAVAAVPAQLCLPLQPGSVSAAIGHNELLLRQGQYEGFGLALDGNPTLTLQTARALAGDAPLHLYVPPAQRGEYQALLAEAGPGITLDSEAWEHWIAGARSSGIDLVPGLGTAGVAQRDWSRWRWPLRLALAAIVVNIVGLNIEWMRLKREADAVRQEMAQTFRSAYPGQPVIDPVAQMRQNIARAKAASGQVSQEEFGWIAGAFGEAVRGLGRPPGIASMEFREQALTVRVKPDTIDPASTGQLRAALGARNLGLEETPPATWVIRSTGPAAAPAAATTGATP
ncbi:type II secretion system protein GspL [Massilia oculi]|uniref:Type II secretion system protein GspL n=1 Tax=Massilia hydrophila TaxID=3044279 RepID=A0ABS7Y8B5_9BURK|nr:type II secretion system protein GspL [Massilia oculi]MCA1855926.1 type II secretion system protein GspL [Massilia oculi]